MKTIVAIIAVSILSSSCATIERVKSHYMLKVCDINTSCRILDVLDSLSYCMELKQQIIDSGFRGSEIAICQGFREP